jgi:hypothetical protein
MADAAAGARHLLAVWNPSYASDAMEAHLTLLLELAANFDDGTLDDDDLYVWWGKVRSSNRQQRLPHETEIAALATEISGSDETQLYLTDYRSLYVADLEAITTDDVAVSDPRHVPAYYRQEKLNCDFWFKVRDIRALVTGDMAGVTAELHKLRNVRYNDRPVSIYGGMVDLPLIVRRDDERHFFDDTERERYTDGRLWAEWDAENTGGVGEMERELRENRFGDALWTSLDPAARRFVASAERAFRDHHSDQAYDFAQCIGGYAKALELQANILLRSACAKLEPKARQTRVDGRTVDLAVSNPLTLGQLARAIGSERELNAALLRSLNNGRWFTETFPIMAEDFVRSVRNPGMHSTRIDRETARQWRARLIGVGCVGELVELARVKVK